MMLLRNRIFLSNLVLLSVVSILFSSTPKLVKHSTQTDFERGKPRAVSIDSYGVIRLAPDFKELFQAEAPFLWTGVADKSGRIFAGGGNDGKIFRIDSDSKTAEIFDAGGAQIYAATVDNSGNLFVGTSPEGRIYRIREGNATTVKEAAFFDPDGIYIWSVLVDKKNNLLVATGEQGRIYRVDSSGKSTILFESEDKHIRKMILDANDNIIAGTSDRGLVLRIDSSGQPFVLYDSPMIEITSLAVNSAGVIFAAASGEAFVPSAQRAPDREPTRPPDSAGSEKEDDVMELPVQTISASGAARSIRNQSEIYRIEPDGTTRTFWSVNRERIYSMALDRAQNVIVGTGDPARLYSIDSFGEATLLTELDELQITDLSRDAAGNIIACASNGGKVYRIGTGFRKSGDYLSEVVDASVSSRWGSLSWEADLPPGTGIEFFTRSGNSKEPDKTWSDWAGPLSSISGEPIGSPPARFLQYKAVFSTKDDAKSASLKEVTFSYLQKNLAPTIREVRIHPEGDYYPESLNQIANDSYLSDSDYLGANGVKNDHPGRKIRRKGGRTVSWEGQDENDDTLTYQLFYRDENESNWLKLIGDFRGSLYSWDSELFPDGRYFIKVVASDELENPPSEALTTEKISPPFKVDNTGPVVGEIVMRRDSGGAKISFSVEDAMTAITTVEVAVNAGKWQIVYPLDGICDSKVESFDIDVSLTQGANSIAIKATDGIDNVGFGKTNVDF